MAAQARQFLANVAAIRQISDFLGEPSGIEFKSLASASQEFANPFLQASAISVNQTRSRILNNRHFGLNLCEAHSHLFGQGGAFNLAHAL